MSFFLLFGAISLGLGTAGATLLAFRLVGRRAPRWLPPLAGGAAMFSFYLWMEYAWFERVTLPLSADIVVVETFERSAWWQPWSLVAPTTVRFTAMDRRTADAVGEDLARVELWLVDRYTGSVRVEQIYDCAEARRLDVTEETRFDEAGRPVDGAWRRIARDNPHRLTACRLAGRPVAGERDPSR